jgi:hypothetical protein
LIFIPDLFLFGLWTLRCAQWAPADAFAADTDPEMFDVGHLPAPVLSAIEADSFWCLSKLLDGIQDNYISQQPGIQRLVKRMGELVKRIDGESNSHRHRSIGYVPRVTLTHHYSTPRGPFRGAGRRVPPVRI